MFQVRASVLPASNLPANNFSGGFAKCTVSMKQHAKPVPETPRTVLDVNKCI